MALTGAHAPGATPLTEEDLEGLRIPSVKTHGELNEVEAANIVRGQEWTLHSRSAQLPQMLSDAFMQRLHVAMFAEVWTWAGKYRRTDPNIGVPVINSSMMIGFGQLNLNAGVSGVRRRGLRASRAPLPWRASRPWPAAPPPAPRRPNDAPTPPARRHPPAHPPGSRNSSC